MYSLKKILICPLDWGLGHATRCIPIIGELQKNGAQVLIASSGLALQLLKQEFPGLTAFELLPYAPVYPTTGSMMLTMIRQLPKFRKVIREEHDHVEQLVQENDIDIIISDNRYGCWSSKARSIFITHQIRPLMPPGFGWLSPIVQTFFDRHLLNFEEIWIPDSPGSGMTKAFNPKPKSNQKYIGWLSRFNSKQAREEKYEIIALVSGPEPQRTAFEKLLTGQLKASGKKSLLVAGEPGKPYHRFEGNLEIVNHLPVHLMEDAIQSSGITISRSGYSTIMDLIALGRKAIFIPTPHQPEQLFLAKYCKAKKLTFYSNQASFSLPLALEESRNYVGLSVYTMEGDYLTSAISTLLQ